MSETIAFEDFVGYSTTDDKICIELTKRYMVYSYQTNWGFPRESGWATVATYGDLERAHNHLVSSSNLARVVCPLRVIDSDGVVHFHWNPEFDWRLPGAFERQQQKRSYKLWDEAGRPDGRSDEFWFEAERQLNEEADVGLREGDFTQEDIDEGWRVVDGWERGKAIANAQIDGFFREFRERLDAGGTDFYDIYKKYPCVLWKVEEVIKQIREKSHEQICEETKWSTDGRS